MTLLDLSREWCIADIHDASYEKHDDIFRAKIDQFNATLTPDEMFLAPERILTHPKLKAEDFAGGQTINKILNSDDTDPDTQKKLVTTISKFYLYQLDHPDFQDENGNDIFICQSDPHVGNYVVAFNQDKRITGVLDRDFYLPLYKDDVNILKKMVYENNPADFANSVIDRLMDINKIRGIAKISTKGSLLAKLGAEAAKTQGDPMAVFRGLLTECKKMNMEVPIELIVSIRNIIAFKRLNQKYGMEFK
jgi:hypothetical protein